MSVAQPTDLVIFDASSGTSITNYGTRGTAFTIQQGTSPTNYAWRTSGPFGTNYYEGITNNSSSMPYATSTGTRAGTVQAVKFATSFQIQSLDNSVASILGRGASDKGLRVRAVAPAGSGNFDLNIEYDTLGFAQNLKLDILALTFNTTYALACMLKTSTLTAAMLRAKLNSASVVTSTPTKDLTGDTLATEQITLFKPDDFTDIRGFDGFCYFTAYDLGGTEWSDSDFADINNDPKATIGGWPGGGPVPGPPVLYRRPVHFVNEDLILL